MLRLKGKHTFRISNRLAIFAALMLLVSSLAGSGNTDLHPDGIESSVKLHPTGFRVSLFLFGNKR